MKESKRLKLFHTSWSRLHICLFSRVNIFKAFSLVVSLCASFLDLFNYLFLSNHLLLQDYFFFSKAHKCKPLWSTALRSECKEKYGESILMLCSLLAFSSPLMLLKAWSWAFIRSIIFLLHWGYPGTIVSLWKTFCLSGSKSMLSCYSSAQPSERGKSNLKYGFFSF